ncbi:MAG: phosphoribosyl-AMP cyclohydrolase [Verrucomicrobiae bacterium]|nr:phosphoribosyl-AMP cyclohydrolase [Verrucomicrobiae bacterium]
MNLLNSVKWSADGLIPAIIQDHATGRVLMMAWMNRAALERTLQSRQTWFWSRSRGKFWMKGETSGHVQEVQDVSVDCDGDTLLIQVKQTGAACHEGYRSCFFRSVGAADGTLLVTESRLADPGTIYSKPSGT